jgi:TolB-like protein/Tfp pilus assembly protein PilF
MHRFLRFVVEQALLGSDLKEYSIGLAVFDKDATFDPRIDNNVRTEARRLRAKLAEYYATAGQADRLRIELPKGSYVPRFTAAEPAAEEAVPAVTPPPEEPTGRRTPRIAILAVGVLLVLAGTALLWRTPIHPAAAHRSIAVLPFLSLSAGEENEYFTEGLSEEILNYLAKVPGIKVVARTSSALFKGRDEDVRTIGKKLNVDTVLEGSVRRSGNRLRITLQLITTSDGYHLWSQTLERDAADLFALQDEASRLVVQALGGPPAGAAVSSSPNPKAYPLYLRARFHWNKWTTEEIQRSLTLLDQAIALDPKYARAYAGLASSYGVLGALGGAPAAESMAKSRAAAQKAVELDPNLADGYAVLACLKAIWDHDWQGAQTDFQRALFLSPGSPDIHDDYASLYLAPWKRLGEAESEVRQALALDPLSLRVNSDLGSILYFRRDYDAAIAQFRQTLDLDPAFGNASMQLFKCFLMKGQYEEARRIIDPPEKSPFPQDFALNMGRVQARSGNRREARKLLDQLNGECAVHCAVSPSQVAWLQAELGDTDGAFRSLEKGTGTILLQVDPVFDSLRADPRYRALLAKLRLTL